MTPVPPDPAAFVAEAERITNERDVEGAAATYSRDARLETITDGAAESYRGREAIRGAWAGYLAAMEARGFVLRKRLVTVGNDTIVNEWEGTLGGRTHARGVEWWRFDDDGLVAEHVLLSFLNVRASSSPLARLRLASLYPVTAVSFLREQRSSLSPAGRAARVSALAPGLQRRLTRAHARLYEATGGRFMPNYFGAPVMLLETVGRKSGKPRSTPVIYLRDEGRLVVSAANGGADRPPAWWLNLRAAGEGVAVLAGKRVRVRPRVAEGAERDRLWAAFAAMYPALEEYRTFTDRELPLVVLEEPQGNLQ